MVTAILRKRDSEKSLDGYKEALKALSALLEKAPTHSDRESQIKIAEIHYHTGKTLQKICDYKNAILSFSCAIEHLGKAGADEYFAFPHFHKFICRKELEDSFKMSDCSNVEQLISVAIDMLSLKSGKEEWIARLYHLQEKISRLCGNHDEADWARDEAKDLEKKLEMEKQSTDKLSAGE